MNISAIPVPDFDDDDDFEPLESYNPLSGCGHIQLNRLFNNSMPLFRPSYDLDYSSLCEKKGLVLLDKSTPIKCTANSAVYAAKSPGNGEMFAVKFTKYKNRIQSEFSNRKSIQSQSPYLLKSISIEDSPTNQEAMLQMEFCPNGDLKSMMETTPVFPEEYLWKMLHDIGHALYELHKNNWMHLDVSPGNVLISDTCFKLSDFGTMIHVGEFDEGMEGAGPYVSPEALAFPHTNYQVNQQTDIFSLGVVLLEVASGRSAPRGGTAGYSEIRNDELKLHHKKTSFSESKNNRYMAIPKPTNNDRKVNLFTQPKAIHRNENIPLYECVYSNEIIHLINLMLSHNPENRPTSLQICNIPQVAAFDTQ